MMRHDDFERRLNNWARWYWSADQRSRGTISSIYNQGPRGRRAEVPMPIIDGEAIETHAAVERLAPDFRNALRARYLRVGPRGGRLGELLSETQVAQRLGVGRDTYERRVSAAKHMLDADLRMRRKIARKPASVQAGTL